MQGDIHVFALDPNNLIVEGSSGGSGSWSRGDLSSMQVQAAAFSNLATISWDDDFTVYYQAEDQTIREITRDSSTGQWSTGVTIPAVAGSGATPLPGTGIAAIGWDGINKRVYYQGSGGNLWEAFVNGTEWYAREMPTGITSELGTPIAATRQLENSGVCSSQDMHIVRAFLTYARSYSGVSASTPSQMETPSHSGLSTQPPRTPGAPRKLASLLLRTRLWPRSGSSPTISVSTTSSALLISQSRSGTQQAKVSSKELLLPQTQRVRSSRPR